MRPLHLLIFFIFWTQLLYGQGNFQISYGSAALDKLDDVNTTPDGGFILAGETTGPDGDQHISLTRTDATGQILWSFVYLNGMFEMPNSVLNAAGGGYVIAGERYPKSGPSELAYVFKVADNGTVQWSRIFNSNGMMAEALAAKNTTDSGFIIAGRAEQTLVSKDQFLNKSSKARSLYLLKLNGEGDPEWSRKYNSGEISQLTRANDVFSCKDGGYAMAAEFKHNTSRSDLDMGLLKVDKSGSVLWARRFGGDKMDAGSEVIQISDGSYILGGETESFGAGKLDLCLVRTSETGDVIWAKTYGSAGFDQMGAICELDNGHIAVVGKTSGADNENVQVLILIIDKNGNVLSSETLGGLAMDNAIAVKPLGAGIIVGANTMSFGQGGMEMMLLKQDLAAKEPCHASDNRITSTSFKPETSDVTDLVVSEITDESGAERISGKGTTTVEKGNIKAEVLCK